jgi:signal transduction histidine kinase
MAAGIFPAAFDDGILTKSNHGVMLMMGKIKKYIIRSAEDKVLSLTVMDFSEILQNEHKGFEHEKLYVFGKDVTLLERNGTEEKTVSLYIKFNKLENCFVIVISFHEQKYPLTYYFR